MNTRLDCVCENVKKCVFLSTEMLQFRKQKSLAAQAMHELGNIMFHSGNIRSVHAHFCVVTEARWRVRALRHFTLTVPLSTQVYIGLPENVILVVAPRRTSIPSTVE